MKKGFFSVFFFLCTLLSYASHIVGGEMIYEYIGRGAAPNTSTYRITLKLFRDQRTTGAVMPAEVFIGIFDNSNGAQFPASNRPYVITKSREEIVSVNTFPQCVSGAPELIYHIGYYIFQVDLPDRPNGFTATYQTCCRVSPLRNVFNTTGTGGSGGTGSTYSCSIAPLPDNSPNFKTSVDLLCNNRQFTLDFSAEDPDSDSLVYSFIEAYNGGDVLDANNVNPAPPPYKSVPYINGFFSEEPLGPQAFINSKTGIITGIAPATGKYVVGVRVKSYKNGKFVNEHRKDFIVNVGNCDFAGAQLAPQPVTCGGFTVSFANANNSPLNKTFFWDFGDPASGANNTSTLAEPSHQFSDTGVYTYKLIVNKGEPCADSTTQIIKVYPGFLPGFTWAGQCKNTPVLFKDTTKSKYGRVTAWSWNFNDPLSNSDTSNLQNPAHTFADTTNYTVSLIVSNDKGCIDTATAVISIKDKPDFTLTNDTLICSIDTLQLNAKGLGTVFWTPGYNISNQNSLSPLVSPDVPTKYYAAISDGFGCKGTDSVFVDVKKFVTLEAGNDSTICLSDAIQFNPVSDALHYIWGPAATLDYDSLKKPTAIPLSNTTYTVTGSIGKCKTSDFINIKVVPYPTAYAGNDSIICFGNVAQLHASGGSIYTWSPAFFLNNPNIADPVANPERDIQYVVNVGDVLGCPKTISDTVLIRVEKIVADAGPADTSVVINQPLQLRGTGGESFLWTPSAGLNNPNISNPVAMLSDSKQYVVRVTTAIGCFDTDTINITVYKIDPGLYVPNAFTPDNDGKNDVFRAVPIGMKTITYFKVFNRWGQLMFSSNEKLKGWDGKFAGKPQDAGVYVWIVEGIDYQDKKITKKGSVILIR